MINGGFSHRMIPILILMLAVLPGCKDPSKGRLGMRPLTSLVDYEASQEGVTLRVKKLDAHDCETILGKPSQRLFKKFRKRQPIWPLQISLTNNTNKLVAMKPSDISLEQLSYKSVSSRLHKNSFTQVFGTIASSLLIGGLLALGSVLTLSASGILLLTTGSFSITAPIAIIGSSALAAIPTLLIIGTPILSTVRGVQTAQNNRVMKQDIKSYALKEQVVVPPYQTADMLIFVSKQNYEPLFSVKVTNPENAEEKITFNVAIPSSPQKFIVR